MEQNEKLNKLYSECINELANIKIEFKCKDIGASDSGIRKQILIIPKSYPVITSITFKVGKTIDHSFDQRQRIEAEK